MKRLLDTNAYSAFRRNHSGTVALVEDAEELVLSMIVVGELLAGFRNGSRRAENERLLDLFLAAPVVTTVPVTRATAEWYARIDRELRVAGTPIPTNDMWIAAHCFESGAELVTFDSDFSRVPGLLVRNPS